MPLTRFLDPRFALVAKLIDDPEETAEMRETARRHAEIIAKESGYSFDEALAVAGISFAAEDALDNDREALADVGGEIADTPSEAGGQIAEALRADPSRSDREVARALRLSVHRPH